jgi:hypothetical protein
MRKILNKLDDVYAKCDSLTEHLAINVIMCCSKNKSFSDIISQRNTKVLG